ncbi:lipid kinase [Pelagibius sp. CAU 1746]|uniref:lipid kinase n=1 Tax=Pelagibius sp. CAU 1746 TaxID=3140370 RepID=UPI00325C0C5A
MAEAVRSVLVLTNKHSGGADNGLEPAVRRLEDAGLSVTLAAPESVDDLRRRIRDSGDSTVILAGGDGTMNAAAPALMSLERPFGILPLGTANDLARTLEIPFDTVQAAAVIAAGRTRRIDLGLIDGRPFFNVASIGLSAEVAREHEGERKKRLGVLNYPLSAWQAFRRHRPFRAELVVDGEPIRCLCMQVAVGNGRHYGGGMTVDEKAQIDDGWLRVYYLRPAGPLAMLRVLPALRFGWLRRAPEAEVKRAKRVELRTRRPRAVNVDGELDGMTPVVVEVLPGAVEVFAPPPAAVGERGGLV